MKNPGAALTSRRATLATALATAYLVAILGATDANAQKTNNDYFSISDANVAASLRSVEQVHLVPGENELRLRQYVQAFSNFTFVLNYFPNHPQALLLMGQLCLQWKSGPCDMEYVFQRAIDVNPNAAGTFVTRGIYLHRAGKVADAIGEYKRALALAPDSVNANYNLGLAYIDTKQYDLANVHAQRAYASGAPLPGLRDKLKAAGHWQPLPESAPGADAPAPAATSPDSNGAPKPGETK